ncbi:MAG: Stp1/IreP family PP2C-type Ser/Thr phosphatase [Actinomycetia bacterium]|nr:Stp1/IreP family PP2C-type Ser/Thr phosphatase [Actinomycetes bacterium]
MNARRNNAPRRMPLADGLKLDVGAASSLGRIRVNNEDAFLVAAPLFIVADGMGGHEAGEVASRLAIEQMRAAAAKLDGPQDLRKAICRANLEIFQAPFKGIGRPGMGTTMTAALIEDGRLLIAQVGDSRAYLLHNGTLQRLTRDHSLVEEMISNGTISEEEAREHPRRGVITRVLGNDAEVDPDLYELAIEPGDQLLLCSDGLHGMITDTEIEELLAASLSNSSSQESVDALIDMANEAGGFDNVTVILVGIKELPKPVSAAPKRRGFLTAIVVFISCFLLIVGGTVGGFWLYAHNSAYLVAENGHVVLYRGLADDVLGFKLQWLQSDTNIPVDKLPAPLPERLQQGVQLGSLQEAEDIVAQYRQQTGSG